MLCHLITSLVFSIALLGTTQTDEAAATRFEKEIVEIEKRIADGVSKHGEVLFVGSSSIRRWDLKKSFPDNSYNNHGFGGSMISDSLHYFDRIVVAAEPSIIVFYAGDNDIAKKKSAETVVADFKTFMALVEEKCPKCQTVLFISIKPSIKRWKMREAQQKANAAVMELSKSNPKIRFVDVWDKMLGSDGQPDKSLLIEDDLHLSTKGYEIWTETIRNQLETVLKSPPQKPDFAQTPVVQPTENLVVDGVPAIPAEIAENVRRYTESRAASFVDWHPVKREMIISTRFGNTPQLHLVQMPGGARKQLTFFAEPVGSASWEPVKGDYFVFSRDTGGNEFGQLHRYDVKTGAVALLTDGGRSQNGGVLWNHAKNRFVYSTTRRNGADRDLWIMDPLNPNDSKPILELSGGGWAGLDWSPDDSEIVAMEMISVNKTNLWRINAATGEKKPLSDRNAQVAFGGAEFSKDGKGLYVTTDKDNEFRRLAFMDLASGDFTYLTSEISWDVDGFELSPDGETIVMLTNEAGISRAYLIDTKSRKVSPIQGLPTGVIGGASWHDNGKDIAFTVNSAKSTSDVYSYNVATGEVSRWTESELGGLVAADLVEPELIRWKSFDGLEISGFLYPAARKFDGKRPVIINIHGGPEGQSQPVFQGRFNYMLNELGVAIIYPNVRGSTGYGKTFVALDNGMKREDSVKDIGALLDWIKTQPQLDADRVMVTGGSYGGYMTLACATHYNDRIRCSLDVVGISHFGTFLKNTESYRRDLRRVEYGDERDPEMSSFFEQIAPLNNVRKISKPLFVVQGGNDPRVPLSEAEQMVAKVKANGSPVWYLMAKDEGHGFRKKSNADFQFYATVLFIRQHLLGE